MTCYFNRNVDKYSLWNKILITTYDIAFIRLGRIIFLLLLFIVNRTDNRK